MPPGKELCRNFQRGSCRYGDQCRFLHATSQQPKANPTGFGMQTGSPFQRTNQQQQMPNPFGFGVQKNTQLTGGNDFGTKPGQFKPGENKWTRFSPINNNNSSSSRQPDSQSATANHKCTDPESCKRIIMEDLQNEKPEWKLTCYGHNRNGPCDIVGDISCEELRALAYDDAKLGKSLQNIADLKPNCIVTENEELEMSFKVADSQIERERSLLNSKLVEFQNLVQKPFVGSSNVALSTQSPFSGVSSNAPIPSAGISPTVSSFSQLGASLNTPITSAGTTPTVSSFTQLGASLNTGSAAAPNYTFGQSNGFQNNNQSSNMFRTNNLPFNSSGTSGSQIAHQSVPSSFSFGTATSSNNALSGPKNPFSTLTNSSQMGNAADRQHFASNVPFSVSSAFGHSSISTQLTDMPKGNIIVDDSIWSKAEWKWNTGEIPEEAPPDIYIR